MSINDDSLTSDSFTEAIRILLVEDSLGSQRAAYTLLTGLQIGCAIEMAKTGSEVLEKIKNRPYHLILTDIDLPDMNGMEMAQSIRVWEKKEFRKPIPIIALTVSAEPYACYRAGIEAVIAKPMTKEIAMSLVEKYLNLKKSF